MWKSLRSHPPSLLAVSQVSKHWRAASTENPSLWTRIYLSDSQPEASWNRAKLWIQRAGSLMYLYIDITFPGATAGTWGEDPQPELFKAATDQLISMLELITPLSPRWRSLTIHAPHYLAPLCRTFLPRTLAVPNLRNVGLVFEHCLNFHDIGSIADMDTIFHVSPPILAFPQLDLACYSTVWPMPALHHLTSLTIGPYMPRCAPHWNLFSSSIADSPTIIYLGLRGGLPDTTTIDDVPPRILSLPSLVTLALSYLRAEAVEQAFNLLDNPALEELSLHLIEEADNFDPVIVILHSKYGPILRTLSISALPLRNNSPHIPTLLNAFQSIHTLRLDFSEFNGVPRHLWYSFLARASQSSFLPTLSEIHFVNLPMASVQEFILQRGIAGLPIHTLRLHEDSLETFVALNIPAWKLWLLSQVKHIFVMFGHPQWAPGFF